MCGIMGFCGKEGDYHAIQNALSRTRSRGPDMSRIINTGNGWLGFNRLSIMGITETGMQPFVYAQKRTFEASELSEGQYGWEIPESSEIVLVCNGEIYGFRSIREELIRKGCRLISESDCEILAPLYQEYGTKMFSMLDAEFAMVMYDVEKDSYIAARDPIGIRPLYYGVTQEGIFVFASEPKNLISLVDAVVPFPPGHYFQDG